MIAKIVKKKKVCFFKIIHIREVNTNNLALWKMDMADLNTCPMRTTYPYFWAICSLCTLFKSFLLTAFLTLRFLCRLLHSCLGRNNRKLHNNYYLLTKICCLQLHWVYYYLEIFIKCKYIQCNCKEFKTNLAGMKNGNMQWLVKVFFTFVKTRFYV